MLQSRFPYFNFSPAILFRLTIITLTFTLVQSPLPLLAEGTPKSWQKQPSYTPPSNLNHPGRTQGGGTRGPVKQLTALIPSSKFGVTEAAYPNFFVYIPAVSPPDSPLPAKFLLEDAQGNEIYKALFYTTGTPGIVMINLPEQSGLPSLEVNKDYQWSFLICSKLSEGSELDDIDDTFDKSDSPCVETKEVQGWVRRVKLDTSTSERLRTASPQKQVEIYTEAGIWHDALATLVELRRKNPLDSAIAYEWYKLLNSVGLSHLTQEVLLPEPQGSRDESISSPSQNSVHTRKQSF